MYFSLGKYTLCVRGWDVIFRLFFAYFVSFYFILLLMSIVLCLFVCFFFSKRKLSFYKGSYYWSKFSNLSFLASVMSPQGNRSFHVHIFEQSGLKAAPFIFASVCSGIFWIGILIVFICYVRKVNDPEKNSKAIDKAKGKSRSMNYKTFRNPSPPDSPHGIINFSFRDNQPDETTELKWTLLKLEGKVSKCCSINENFMTNLDSILCPGIDRSNTWCFVLYIIQRLHC